MPVTPAHTSGTWPGSTNTPSRWASMGLVDRPPPTHRSNPGVPPGPRTPTNEMSLISCAVHRDAQPLTVVLYLRGRLVNAGRVVATSSVARSTGLASRISRASMPATGQPRMFRGTSPHACWLDRPTDSSRSQIAGTSSIDSQWYCTFCRSVMSARSRPYSLAIPATVRSCAADSWPPGMRTRIMKCGASMSASSSAPVLPPPMPGRRWVYRPHHRNLPRRSAGSIEPKPRWAYRLMIRSRTFSPSSSFLKRSAAFSGSWWPRAHWPWPRRDRAGMSLVLLLRVDTRRPRATRARAAHGRTWSAEGTTDGAGYAQQVHMTAAHERHLTAAGGGAGHGPGLLVRPAGTASAGDGRPPTRHVTLTVSARDRARHPADGPTPDLVHGLTSVVRGHPEVPVPDRGRQMLAAIERHVGRPGPGATS